MSADCWRRRRLWVKPENGISVPSAGLRLCGWLTRRQRWRSEVATITIYGLDLPEEYYRKGFRRKGMEGLLRETFGEPEKGRFTILLAHTPRYWREYLDWGASLTLSGHYHGGVCLLGKRRGLITPDYRSRWPLSAREYATEGTARLTVGAGAGEHTVPVRIHNPREITLLEIAFGEA
ncbi:MAG: hypothetical protein ACLRT5_03620 [Lachnospiraceae bacterium]